MNSDESRSPISPRSKKGLTRKWSEEEYQGDVNGACGEGKNMSIEDKIKAVKHCAISTLLVVTRSRAAKDLVMQLDCCYVPCK